MCCIVKLGNPPGAFKSTLELRGEVAEMTTSYPPKKWAKTSRRQDRHESKKVRGQAPGQEEAGRHTKEMRANEEEVKRARMGVAMEGCSGTAEDHPPPTVSRGDEEEEEVEEECCVIVLSIYYVFFFFRMRRRKSQRDPNHQPGFCPTDTRL